MHSNTMGPCPINPLQSTNWFRENSPDLQKVPFPSRVEYGEYLKTLLQNMIDDCKALAVKFGIIREEVITLTQNGDNLRLKLLGGHEIATRDVVLALGNFYSTSHKDQFCGNPNYFSCPWPIEKLNGVAPGSDIFIMGSRLTAIYVANALVQKGHKGVITFISHSGRLPKVQGKQHE
jgi:uncharacterized NAD(P)/FAD-binding protein YdhS